MPGRHCPGADCSSEVDCSASAPASPARAWPTRPSPPSPQGRSSRSGRGRAPVVIPKVFETVGKQYGKVACPELGEVQVLPLRGLLHEVQDRGSRRPRARHARDGVVGELPRGGRRRHAARSDQGHPDGLPRSSTRLPWRRCGTRTRSSGIPMDLNTLTIAYNKDIFAKLGLKIPTTLDELLAHGAEDQGGGLAADVAERQGRVAERRPVVLAARLHGPERKALRSAEAGKAPVGLAAVPDGCDQRPEDAAAGLFSQNAASLDFVGAYTEFATGKSAMLYPVGNFGTPVIDSIGKGNIKYGLFPFPPAVGRRHAARDGRRRDHLVDPDEDQERRRGTRARPRVLGPVRHQDPDRRRTTSRRSRRASPRTTRRSTSRW